MGQAPLVVDSAAGEPCQVHWIQSGDLGPCPSVLLSCAVSGKPSNMYGLQFLHL